MYLNPDEASPILNVLRRTRRTAAQIALARTATTIERHRLAHHTLPPTLPVDTPLDPVNAQPLHYQILTPERYKLWSLADNQVDDYGAPGPHKIQSPSLDWVWLSYIVPAPPHHPPKLTSSPKKSLPKRPSTAPKP